MNQDHRETIGGIAAAATGNLIVVIVIIVSAVIGYSAPDITSAISQWVGQ